MATAYLIDPFERSVQEVNYWGDYKEIYKHIKCDLFTCVYLNTENDCVFVDDEGLWKDNQAFFRIEGYPEPLAGRGLVLGTDDEGESCSPKLSFDDVRRMISFPVAVIL